MRRFAWTLILVLSLALSACGNKVSVTVDYGSSEIYTQKDMDAAGRVRSMWSLESCVICMDAAIRKIRAEFDTWKGCELHAIRYAGDECCTEENIRWLNGHTDDGTGFTQCIEFLSDFHSPRKAEEAGAFNPDSEYTDWNWWLARTEGGDWVLLDWGY